LFKITQRQGELLIGKIIKIHSNFYFAQIEDKIFECKIREKLKKEKINLCVGDLVKLEEVNHNSTQAVISELLERKNFITRPSISNIDQVIVVAGLEQPTLDFIQLNRFLTLSKIHSIPAIICINKVDLDNKSNIKNKILSIYASLGYQIIFTSIYNNDWIKAFKNILNSKISVLTGLSGVGKSSILNKIHPELNLKTRQVSEKSLKGTHSTRHVELLNIPLGHGQMARIADTPGFSYSKFDNVLPALIAAQFDEIKELSAGCHFDNCLHLEDSGCNVLQNLDKIDLSRYESYKIFTIEALEYKEKLTYKGHKIEKRFKILDTQDKEKIRIVKFGTQSKERSRKFEKQQLNLVSILDDAYYNDLKNTE